MSETVIGSIIGSTIQSIIMLIFIKKNFNFVLKENSKFTVKDVVFVISITILLTLMYNIKYNLMTPIVFFLASNFELVFIYKENISKVFVACSIFMIFLFLSDAVVSLIFVNFFEVNDIRSDVLYIVITNSFVGAITILLLSIEKINLKLIQTIELSEKKENLELVIFMVFLILSLSIVFYIIYQNFMLNNIFVLSILIICGFVIISIIFFKEKYEKEKIIIKYDQLFDYLKTFEEWMDLESINIHESKNQWATLRDMVKRNKKAADYIDNIMQERINLKSQNVQKIKNIPKGGLKGLLYYKITIAENSNIEVTIDISNNVDGKLKKLNIEENKLLCRLVGIFFDNAIESAKESIKRKICCEFYTNVNNIVIVISNTFSKKIEINKINQKGYTTKGKNRGNGLYLAHKFASKHKNFKLNNMIINDYYIQKIIINI